MTASEVLKSLEERGIHLEPDGDKITLSAPLKGMITPADRQAVAQWKPQIMAILTRAPLGSIRRPLTVRGSKLNGCPFDGCAGEINHHEKSNLKLCGDCGWYFELLPMEGVYL